MTSETPWLLLSFIFNFWTLIQTLLFTFQHFFDLPPTQIYNFPFFFFLNSFLELYGIFYYFSIFRTIWNVRTYFFTCAKIPWTTKVTMVFNHPVPNSFQMFFFAPQNCVLCLFLNIFPVLYSGKGLPWIAWNLQSISTLPFRGWSQTKCFVHLCESVSTLM